MIHSEKCETCGRDATKATECPVHGRHYSCDHCSRIMHKAQELGDAIFDSIKDMEDQER